MFDLNISIVVYAKVGGGLLKFIGLGLKFKITPPSFRDATPRVLGLTKRIVKRNAPAHFGHRLQSIHRRRRLPLWRKFNYVFTLNLRRYYYRMVCIAIDVWVIYIYNMCACKQPGLKLLWSYVLRSHPGQPSGVTFSRTSEKRGVFLSAHEHATTTE